MHAPARKKKVLKGVKEGVGRVDFKLGTKKGAKVRRAKEKNKVDWVLLIHSLSIHGWVSGWKTTWVGEGGRG